MARVMCDKCGIGYQEERDEIRKINELDVCYKCGGYTPDSKKTENESFKSNVSE